MEEWGSNAVIQTIQLVYANEYTNVHLDRYITLPTHLDSSLAILPILHPMSKYIGFSISIDEYLSAISII
jgi:hypothetical protein